ncbi:MAG TPA: S41 family peptidase [Verrucomicrobiae bacterium]
MLVAGALVGNASATEHEAGRQPFDRAEWKNEFERVKLGLAQGYANLDWQIERRGLNLQRMSEQIHAMLDRANSDVEAVVVFTKLIHAFKDPHLQLQIGPPPASATLLPKKDVVEASAPSGECCSAAQSSAAKGDTRLPYPRAAGWKQLSSVPFRSGVLGDVGFLRIPSFSEEDYPASRQKVARTNMNARAIQLATRAELNRQLTEQIAALRGAGVRKLVIDVTGNGGGSEWSTEVAGLLASGKLTRRAPMLANPSCDRASVWEGKRPCSIYGKAAETEELQGRGVWNGPLAVLTDRRSASATEELVTWLKDNKKAVIAGERTFGAGCGYVDGGSAIALNAANLHIMVPNCSRYTSEGVNEIEGIAPDVAADWATLEPEEIPRLLEKIFERR